MANLLSLAAKINADASGFKLDPVQKALRALGEETDKVASIFDKFTDTSEAAARAQADTSKALQDLIAARREGTVSAEEFAKAFERIRDAATQEAAALQRAADITQANLTPLERYDQALAELNEQLNAGRISLETYTRATERAAKGLTDAERASVGLAAQQKTIEDSADKTTLKFNELSGVFSALPGPLGNIAGRISGISSASQGLSRIFAGGLSTGITNLASAFTALINPVSLALAGVTAFGAAATLIAQGLSALDDRVEKLGNTASKLGLSFQFVQVLDESARRSGTSIDAVSAAFGRLQKSVLGVDEDSKSAQKALADLGITAQEIQELNPQEQYLLIGQRLREIVDPAQRTAAATALFGRAGAELLPFFENIGGAADDIERFGQTLSDIQKRDIDSFGSSMDRLTVATQSAKEQLLAEFAPAATRTADALAVSAGVVARNADAIFTGFATTLDGLTGGSLTAVALLTEGVSSFSRESENAANAANATSQSVAALRENAQALIEEERQQAAERSKFLQGFTASVSKAVDESAKFGQAGFDAALQYQNSITELQRQFDQGIINEESFKRAAEQANQAYRDQIDTIRAATEEVARKAQAEADAVQSIIDANLERIRVDEQFGGDSNRAKAADNLNKLLAEQVRVEEQLRAARAAGDVEAINALAGRLATLDQVAAREQDIASGAAKTRQDAEKAAADAAKEADRLAQQRANELERINEQILNRQEEFSARQFEIELDRARELASARTGSVEVADIREGGIGAFLATLREDPAITEAKKQSRELEQIRKGIDALKADRVDILAGAG